jgi:hypothetical protein
MIDKNDNILLLEIKLPILRCSMSLAHTSPCGFHSFADCAAAAGHRETQKAREKIAGQPGG